jgi:hypothetical protein
MANGSFVPVAIAGCVTVDAGHDSDDFLDTAWTFLNKPPRHSGRIKAAANLLNCLRASGASSTVNIIGHGYQGLILTGTGDTPTSSSPKFVGIANVGDWKSQKNLKAIGKVPIALARLCACDSGAGPDGANLLFHLATTLGAPIEAPTGILFCDSVTGFFLEPGATWLKVTPGGAAPPAPIYPPQQYVTNPAMDVLVFGSPSGDFSIPVSDVTAIAITPSNFDPFRPVSFPGDAARHAATFAAFNNPLRLRAVPAAMVTGTFLNKFKHNGQDEQRSLRILNDRLLQDVTMADVHYYYYANVADLIQRKSSRE